MTLPAIAPTGAMASGDYVEYMLGYLDTAMTSVENDIEKHMDYGIKTDWASKWGSVIGSQVSSIDDMTTDINIIKAKIRMISDSINKL